MSYSTTLAAILGAGKTGLASTLRAQLVDTAGADVGAAQSGFVEAGTSGSYMVTLTVPDSHRGGCKVYDTGSPTDFLALAAINPEEIEGVLTTPAEATGRPATTLGMIRRLFEWAANKRSRDRTTGDVVLFGADNTTTLETQTQSTSGDVDTQSKGA